MKARAHDASRLDVEAFAKDGASLEGRWPLRQMQRLVESAHADAQPGVDDAVAWQARGELRAVRGEAPQIWLHVAAQAQIGVECQRCLQPVPVPLQAQRSFRFVHGEAVAAELDAQSEDDVLALTRALDLRELVEDELLLSLPLVPRHEVCALPADGSQPLPAGDEPPHPFAALAALKGRGSH